MRRLLDRVAGITMDEAVDLYEARVARLLIHGERAEREALQRARRSARLSGLEQEYVRARHDAATAWRDALPEVQGPWMIVGQAIANAAGALVVYTSLDDKQLQALNGPWRVAMGSIEPVGPGVRLLAGARTRLAYDQRRRTPVGDDAVVRSRALATALAVWALVGCSNTAESRPPPLDPSVEASDAASASPSASATSASTPSAEPEPMELLAAGDVADCSMAGAALTSELIADFPDATIAVLGDLAYPTATAERFDSCYDPTWGQFLDRTRPAIGNHDVDADSGAPYYDTFGEAAGTPGEGWYSYELGEWHVVVLNSNCDRIGCEEGSPQHQWLVADLAASDATCTLAYWHHPRFTSGKNGDFSWVGPFWTALADAGAELVLVGHDHHYERFASLAPDGTADPNGIREFIVGTGGAVIRPAVRVAPGSEVIVDDAWGVLHLTLSEDAYAWSFLTVDRGEADAGSGECDD